MSPNAKGETKKKSPLLSFPNQAFKEALSSGDSSKAPTVCMGGSVKGMG